MQIAIWRTLPVEPFGYWHHGVLCPDNTVIHFKSRASLRAKKHAKIVHSSLGHFRGTTTPKTVPIYHVRHRHPLPTAEVVRRAKSQLGKRGYSLLHNNCENFARWCVVGDHRSYQIENLQGAFKKGYNRGLVPGALHAVAKTAAKDIPTIKESMVPLKLDGLERDKRRYSRRSRKDKEKEREREREKDRESDDERYNRERDDDRYNRERDYTSSTEVAGVDVEVDSEGEDIIAEDKDKQKKKFGRRSVSHITTNGNGTSVNRISRRHSAHYSNGDRVRERERVTTTVTKGGKYHSRTKTTTRRSSSYRYMSSDSEEWAPSGSSLSIAYSSGDESEDDEDDDSDDAEERERRRRYEDESECSGRECRMYYRRRRSCSKHRRDRDHERDRERDTRRSSSRHRRRQHRHSRGR